MKKKFMLSILVALMLVVASLPLFAAEAPVIYIDTTGVPADMEAGTEFSVALKIKNNPGLASIVLKFTYPEHLELKDISKTGAEAAFGGFTPNPAKSLLVLDESGDVTTNGLVATLKFVVKAGVPSGTMEIGVLVDSACNYDTQDYFVAGDPTTGTTEAKSVTTKCVHTPATDFTKTPDEHYKLCTKCGEKLDKVAHTFTYANTNAEQHTKTCSVCTYSASEAHTYTYAKKDASVHTATCSVCSGANDITHQWPQTGVVKTPATCVAKGTTTYTCSDCSETKDVDDIAQLEHKYGDWVKVDDDNHKRTCTTCPTTPADEQVASHNWNAGVITTPATHATIGVKTFTCTTCAATKTEDVPVNPDHNWSAWTSTGELQHKRTCSVGSEEEVEDHAWNAGVVTKVATCKEEGIKHHKCTVCGYEKDFSIEKLPEHTWEDWKVKDMDYHTRTCKVCAMVEDGRHDQGRRTKTNASCTEDGAYTYFCTECNAKTGSVKIRAKGHVFTDWTLDTAATATSDSVYKRTCRVCAYVETSTVKCEHTETKAETKEATCTDSGYVRKVCASCGYIVESEDVSAKGHTAGEWEVSKEATETEKGLKVKKCTVCGEVVESEEIAMLETTTTTTATTVATTTVTTAATTATEPDEKSSNTGLIIALSAIGVVAVATGAVLLLKKKKA